MFCFTGLNINQPAIIVNKLKIFMLKCGRNSISGLNMQHIPYVVKAIKDVLENL